MFIDLLVYTLILIGLFTVCDNRFSKKYYVPLKGVCSASFLIILALHNMFSEKGDMLIWPLIACFVGDIMMGLYNTYSRKRFMSLGMVSFMLGHVGFIYYMCQTANKKAIWAFIVPFALCILMYAICTKLHIHMGKLLYPGLIYCYFVSAMFLKSLTAGPLGVAGTLFFLSDFSIMFLYFYHYKNRTHKKWVHYFNLATYYYAIYLFIVLN